MRIFLFQFVNVILLTCEAVYLYVPSIWIVFGLIMWEGLLAGAAYVNTFYRVANEVELIELCSTTSKLFMSLIPSRCLRRKHSQWA